MGTICKLGYLEFEYAMPVPGAVAGFVDDDISFTLFLLMVLP
jgi:hypothetical protein